MLDKKIPDTEKLYRVVKTYPNWWKLSTNRPSSAVFKDSNGVSVDRQGDRNQNDIINTLKSRFILKAILSVLTGKCIEIGTFPIYNPSQTNIYHAEIHESENKTLISSSKARRLSKMAEIVFLNYSNQTNN